MPLATFGGPIYSRPDFNVNQFTTSAADGRTAIIPFNDLIRIYDSAGDLTLTIDRRNGGAELVNNITAACFLNDGGLVVAGADGSNALVFQIYNADGTARTGVVQTGRPYAYASNGEIVEALPNGGFVFAFDVISEGTTPVPGGVAAFSHGIFVQTFNAQGVATTAAYDIHANPSQLEGYQYDGRSGEQDLTDVDVLANGQVVVTYRGDRYMDDVPYPIARPYNVFRVIAPNATTGQTTAVVGETPYVQTGIDNTVQNPENQWNAYSTAVLPDGRLVGLYNSSYNDAFGTFQDLRIQVRNANGTVSGPEVALGIPAAGFLQSAITAIVQATDAGTILVAFMGFDQGANVVDNANVNVYINEYSLAGVQLTGMKITGGGRDILGSFERGPDGLYQITWFNQADARTYTQNFVYTTPGELAQVYGDAADAINRGGAHDIIDAGGGADSINGGAGNDTLMGGAGNDTIDGGLGADKLMGGTGDDTYLNVAGDQIVEYANSGIDTVVSATAFSLASLTFVENVTLTGAANVNATGNGLANYLLGNAGVNVLTGGLGDDTLEGGAGADTLIGGSGSDTYRVQGMGDTIVEANGQGFDRVISDGSFSLATLGSIERLELVGGIPGFLRGNANGNTLIGNTGSNTMEGLDGNDTILGLGGRDTITGGMGRDQIAPGLERDTVKWNSVAESTGANRDIVSEFVFASGGPYESLDFHFRPTDIATTITTGTLSEASFNIDLQNAVTGARLGVGEAVLFDPNAGDLNIAGRIFLIVDANGVAGYQANQDYVVEFSSTYGTLTLANFI